ncbi:tRNA (guanine-N(7)-)-methyltransferase non-catalytic subunit wdr4 [Olea europaea subsp. europaea]|uniref:tRNA (Guanine-N(7)-)-methyltransferase non-catalytic subunit wdr4 n=1 Tax=Olea europaea subsp. europaea TaxID=158383 RepID=A0A8S0PGA9_OLEEU|nr:tRNA (guanine-N(7)-)-methyltransferase non-catalytic subunit wdr4 [Olea europaea subsp. europaea]
MMFLLNWLLVAGSVVNRASEKRVSAVGISNYGKFVCFADKFGVVYVVDIEDHNMEDRVPVNKKGIPILSHYCSIITRLVELLHSNGQEEAILPAVTDFGAMPDGSVFAVALQSLPGVMLLRCNHSTRTLSVAKASSFVLQKSDNFLIHQEVAEIAGGESLLQTLKGKLSIGKISFSSAAEAVKTAMRNLLIKKRYSARDENSERKAETI